MGASSLGARRPEDAHAYYFFLASRLTTARLDCSDLCILICKVDCYSRSRHAYCQNLVNVLLESFTVFYIALVLISVAPI